MHPETLKLILIAIALIVLLLSGCVQSSEPRFAPPPDALLPGSDDGYELYSWRLGRVWHHTLITATRRAKTMEEITAGDAVVGDSWVHLTVRGVHELDTTIERLPDRTTINWIGPRALRQRGTRSTIVQLPPQQHVARVRDTCSENGIDLQVEA